MHRLAIHPGQCASMDRLLEPNLDLAHNQS
jgi:hypothetical protein